MQEFNSLTNLNSYVFSSVEVCVHIILYLLCSDEYSTYLFHHNIQTSNELH